MKYIWMLLFMMVYLSQGLMAIPSNSSPNQEPPNESPSEKKSLFSPEDSTSETKQEEEIVTSLPNESKTDMVPTIMVEEEIQDIEEEKEAETDEVEEVEVESRRAARGLELGMYGKNIKFHRSGPKMKIANPRRGHVSSKFVYPLSPAHHRPTKYGQPQSPFMYRGYVPENMKDKMPMRAQYEDKMIKIMKEKMHTKRVPSRQMAVLPPKLIYSGPVPISFGTSDASYQVPFMATEAKRPPLSLMYQSPPTYSAQIFKEDLKEPISHANYHDAIIPVTEMSDETIHSSISSLVTVTVPTLPESFDGVSNLKFASSYATSSTDSKGINTYELDDYSTSDTAVNHKSTFDYELPMNYYGLPYVSTENTRYGGKYKFGYRVTDHESGNDFGQEEKRDGDFTDGRYHVLLPDGRVQNVNYHVDHTGYYADVSYKKDQLEKLNKERELMNRERDMLLRKEKEQLFPAYDN